jgi:hypothetical protein
VSEPQQTAVQYQDETQRARTWPRRLQYQKVMDGAVHDLPNRSLEQMRYTDWRQEADGVFTPLESPFSVAETGSPHTDNATVDNDHRAKHPARSLNHLSSRDSWEGEWDSTYEESCDGDDGEDDDGEDTVDQYAISLAHKPYCSSN